jgi:deoxyribodipyrimidine photo-lyase
MWRARRPDATGKTHSLRDEALTPAAPNHSPIIVWFRRDLRLTDNPALHAAARSGRPIIPLFILDETRGVRFPGGASLWWLDKSLRALDRSLSKKDSSLILRRGDAAKIIPQILDETGAQAIYWNRLYDPGQRDRDGDLKAALKGGGVEVESFNAALLIEPWEIRTKTGGPYHVFTPFWRAVREAVGGFTIHPAPKTLIAPSRWPRSDKLKDWGLQPTKPDWSAGFDDWTPGEEGAGRRLDHFIDTALGAYPEARDRPSASGTSRLSPHLHWGEIGARQVWRAVERATRHHHWEAQGEKFFAELGWREFNHHLLFERPDLPDHNFKAAFDDFPWRTDQRAFAAWTRGRTGYPMVDAGMRELWATGYMENRVRMIAASFLIKHLLIDWRAGERWFWDTLLDASPANNVLNWQWVAGSGADAAPFFRIFNPFGQGEKFDPEGAYVRRWVPELAKLTSKYIHQPWTAPADILEAAGVELGSTYPKPIIDHDLARKRALEAFKAVQGKA